MLKANVHALALAVLAGLSGVVQAQVVNWHFEGQATSYYDYTYPWTSPPVLDNSVINQNGGTTVLTDVTVDLTNDKVLGLSVYSKQGNGPAILMGSTSSFYSSSYVYKVASGTDNASFQSDWIYAAGGTAGTYTVVKGITAELGVAGTGLGLSSYSYADLNNALLAGNYSAINESFTLGYNQPRTIYAQEYVNITSFSMTPVPEPTSEVLLGLGLTALMGGAQLCRRRATASRSVR